MSENMNTNTAAAAALETERVEVKTLTADEIRAENAKRKKAAIAAYVKTKANIPDLLRARTVSYKKLDENGAETDATALCRSVDMMTDENRKTYRALCKQIAAVALAARVENEHHTGDGTARDAHAVTSLRKMIKKAWQAWGVKNDVNADAMLAFATRATAGKGLVDLKTGVNAIIDAIDGAFVAGVIKRGKIAVMVGGQAMDFKEIPENAETACKEVFGGNIPKGKKVIVETA